METSQPATGFVIQETGQLGERAQVVAEDAIRKRNVRMMFAFQLVNAVASGIAMGPIFDRYLYGAASRGDSLFPASAKNSLVGIAESVSGLSGLVFALPVGFMVDRQPMKRARLLWMASIVCVVAAACAVAAVLSDSMLLWFLTLFIFGMFAELSSSASEALFADSIPQGERSGLFTTKGIISTVGSACGPALSAIGLWFMGDDWETYQMKAVIIVGSLLFPVSCIPLLFFKDPASAGKPDSHGQDAASNGDSSATSVALPQRKLGCLRPRHVPVLLSVSDFISCIGAGMTVKFFNLFFIEDQHFSPIQICVLQTAYPLVIAVFMKFTTGCSGPLGRAQTSLLFFSSNVVCLFLMSQVQLLPLLLVVFLVRGGLANSTYPIDRSILMDFTPSTQRGRWNAVASLTSMTWSGSAFVGGLLSDAHDYRFTFAITALVYFTACIVYSPLLALVPRKEASVAAGSGDSSAAREVPLMDTNAVG